MISSRRIALCVCLLTLFALASSPLRAEGLFKTPEFLPVDEAFRLGVDLKPQGLRVFWQLAPGYYLYRHRLAFELTTGGELASNAVTLPDGEAKQDEYFGDVEVYYSNLSVPIVLPAELPADAVLAVDYQGCADAGLCYPPERRYLALHGGAAGMITRQAPNTPAVTSFITAEPVTEAGHLAVLLGSGDLLHALGIFLLAGIGLAFTPCVLPMAPILSSIIIGQGGGSRARATLLSGVYVLAMAITYAGIGMAAGFFGGVLNIQGWLQSPPVLVAFAGLFVMLALAMFDLYTLRLPAALRERFAGSGGRGGHLAGVAALGAWSSVLVSPCISAPLAGALVYIGSTGDALLGGSALFALALGMGIPLMIIGVGGGALLPRVGAWMNGVKAAFGVLLLAVAVWLLERLVPAHVALLLWAVLAVGSGVALGAFDCVRRESSGRVWQTSAGVMLLVYGVLLVIGGALGARDPLRPLEPLTAAGLARQEMAAFQTVDTLADVNAALAVARTSDRPVFLDFYADWCVSCRLLERRVFPDPEVQRLLAGFNLLRVDMTANDTEHRALLAHFGLFGPPSLLFFDSRGVELHRFRLQGEVNAEDLAHHLEAVLAALY